MSLDEIKITVEMGHSDCMAGQCQNWSRVQSDGALKQWSIKILKGLLFFNTYDPFQVYKLSPGAHKIYKADELQISDEGSWSDHRKQLRRVLLIVLTYFIVKNSTIAFIQYQLSENGNQELLVHLWLWREYSLSVNALAELIGNPLSLLANLSIFFYLGISISSYNYLVVMPAYYATKPMDMPILRLLLDPAREVRRLDLTIRKTVDDILASIHFHKLQQISLAHNPSANKQHMSLKELGVLWESLERNRKQLLECRSQSEYRQLRLPMYSSSWLAKFHSSFTRDLFGLVIGNYCWMAVIMWFLFSLVLGGRCAGKLNCRFSEVFTSQERLFLAEITLNMICCLHTYTLHLIMLAMAARSHLKMSADIKHELDSCLNRLRLAQVAQTVGQEGRVSLERQVDALLIETLIKVLVCQSDLKRCIKCLSQLMTTNVVNSAGLLCVSLVTESTSTSLRYFRLQILVINWIIINMLAMLCASLVARVLKLERYYWTILAEISIRRREGLPSPAYDIVSILWHKLVFSLNSSYDQYTVSPFSLSLTYKRIIEVNFFIVSLTSILLAR